MNEQQAEQIDRYFMDLEDSVAELQDCLDEISNRTVERKFEDLQPIIDRMPTAIANLELMLDQRGKLLSELNQDGRRPKSLRAFLRGIGDTDRLLVAESIAERIEAQRRRAVTVFTAHYWLFETTRDVVRILTSRGPNPRTYGPQARGQGGGLLDEAA
jgi:predicted RNase H-like nuclease (RuvC/YqgF family)